MSLKQVNKPQQFSLRSFLLCVLVFSIFIAWSVNYFRSLRQPPSVYEKYDDLEFYENSGSDNGIHVDVFVSWLIGKKELLNPELDLDVQNALRQLESGKLTAREFIVDYYDQKLMSELMSDRGQRFSAHFYDKYRKDFPVLFQGGLRSQRLQTQVDELLDTAYQNWESER